MWQLGEDGEQPEWRTVETPFDETLFGVAQTSEGPYAVGSNGYLVGDRGNGWEVIFDDGPSTRNNQMRAMDTTDDGERIWMLGSSGAMACYDVQERKKFDYSYPEEMTSTWEGITVSGECGNEKALASNGSGEVLPFTIDGFDVDWGQLDKPAGKGSKMAALASTPGGVGFAVDTSGNAFKTTPDEGWTDVGIVNAQVKFYDIYAGANQRVYVAAGDGRIYRYDDSYHNWTPIGVTNGASLTSFGVYETEDGRREMVVLGSDGSIYERTGAERWERIPSPTTVALNGLELGDPDVAVGKNGTVIERHRGKPRSAGTSADDDQFDGRGETYDGDKAAPGDEGTTASAGGSAEVTREGGSETSTEADASGETATDGDTDAADAADADSEDDPDAADKADAGISRWSDSPDPGDSPDLGDSTDSEDSQGPTSTSTRTSTSTSDSTSGSTDAETKENVLVAIAERTELEAEDVTEAAEYGSDVVESVLVKIAEDVGIDPQRVRDALHSSPE
jgi:hypothetical protein